MTVRDRIGGTLDTAALARLHFTVLSDAEKAAAVHRLRATGMSSHAITEATGLALALVERVLAGEAAA